MYLGKAEKLTLERLNDAAEALARSDDRALARSVPDASAAGDAGRVRTDAATVSDSTVADDQVRERAQRGARGYPLLLTTLSVPSVWLAWSLTGLSVAMFLAILLLYVLAHSSQKALTTGRALSGLLINVPFLAFPLVGALIVSRRPRNSIGWICLTVGFLWREKSSPFRLTDPLIEMNRTSVLTALGRRC